MPTGNPTTGKDVIMLLPCHMDKLAQEECAEHGTIAVKQDPKMHLFLFIQSLSSRPHHMDQQVEVLAEKPGYLRWIPGTHMEGDNQSPSKLSSDVHKSVVARV